MATLEDKLTFKIEWCEEEWGVETWVVVDRSPDPENSIISKASPLGKALANGDETFISPDGQKRFRILDVKDETGNIIAVADVKKKAYSIQRVGPISSPSDLRLAALIQDALSDSFRYKFSIPLPELDDNDIRLALRWYGVDQTLSKEQIIKKFDKKEKYEIARMLSARTAEKAVINFFERMLTGEIKDVSISQLNNSVSQSEWKQYDILADGIPYDVKNSRRTRLNDSNYVEHCIPHFKEARGTDIKIIGTLSHYLSAEELLDHDQIFGFRHTSIRILGCTDLATIEKLKAHFETDTFRLEFYRPQREEYFLPSWVFDYPPAYYSKRESALRQMMETVSLDDWVQSHRNPIPFYLALALEPPAEWLERMQYTWQVDFIRRMASSHGEFGLSLPAVFLTILTHFLDMAAKQDQNDESYNPSAYRELIFPTRIESSPSFVYDPLGTVESLIETLTILWQARSNRLQDYSSFQLVSSGILRGSLKSNPAKKQSLVAYCGGRTSEKAPCGNVPLVLGKHEHCSCGMLICNECGYCSHSCPHNKPRQAKFSSHSQPVVISYSDFGNEEEIPW